MYQKTKFENGLRVVTHDMKERESVSLGLWVAAGGRYETDRIKGAAHFLEHMAFKGSPKYSCDQVKELIEGVGGSVNAFTSEEQTCYYAKFPAQHLSRIFDVLSDIVFYPSINAKDVAKESTVIVEEIKMYKDLPAHEVHEKMSALLWPKHSLGRPIAGTPESVKGLSRTSEVSSQTNWPGRAGRWTPAPKRTSARHRAHPRSARRITFDHNDPMAALILL